MQTGHRRQGRREAPAHDTQESKRPALGRPRSLCSGSSFRRHPSPGTVARRTPERPPRGPCRSTSCNRPVGRCAARTARSPGRRTCRRSRRGTPAARRPCALAWQRRDRPDSAGGRFAAPCLQRTPAPPPRRRTHRRNRGTSTCGPGTPSHNPPQESNAGTFESGSLGPVENRHRTQEGRARSVRACPGPKLIARRIRAASSPGSVSNSSRRNANATHTPERAATWAKVAASKATSRGGTACPCGHCCRTSTAEAAAVGARRSRPRSARRRLRDRSASDAS
jgi:hypothetical protein